MPDRRGPLDRGNSKRLTCALLTTFRYDWAAELVAACPGLDVVTLDPSLLGLSSVPNPFGLRMESQTDAVVISNIWLRWLTENHAEVIGDVLGKLGRHGGALVALDSADDFGLGFPADQLAPFEVILKPQGLYRDRDLFNFKLGAWYPGRNWTKKITPREAKFRQVDLEKIRLSVPCFMTDFPPIRRIARAREQGPSATRGRPLTLPEQRLRDLADMGLMALVRSAPVSGPTRDLDVHCVVSLTHIQRLEALKELEGYEGMRGITRVPDFVAGVTPREQWSTTARDKIVQAAKRFSRKPISRPSYFMGLTRHRVVVAPTGFGELGNRHAAAMFAGAALICQDLSHVEMMYPIIHEWNAMFCRPDLRDLGGLVDFVLETEDARLRIAMNGRESMVEWSRHWRKQLFEGIERHIQDAMTK